MYIGGSGKVSTIFFPRSNSEVCVHQTPHIHMLWFSSMLPCSLTPQENLPPAFLCPSTAIWRLIFTEHNLHGIFRVFTLDKIFITNTRGIKFKSDILVHRWRGFIPPWQGGHAKVDMPGKHGDMCGTNHGRQDAQIEIACLHWLDFFLF